MATNLVFSVQKALIVLDLLIFEDLNKNGLRLSEISKKTGIKPNTLHNLLRTMIAQNYIQQYKNGNYTAGIKVDRISLLRQLNRDDHKYGPLNILESLRDDIKENVVFTVLLSGWLKLIKEFPYESAIQINKDKFVKRSIYEMATGRILVSYCSDQEFEAILKEQGMPGDKWDNIKTMNVFQDARRFTRKNYWVDMYSQNDQLWAIGVPVLNKEGGLIGAIGCAAPAFRCDEVKRKYIKMRFEEVASEIKNHIIFSHKNI